MLRNLSSKSKQIINITKDAWNKMVGISQTTNTNTFLFSAESGGCSGFNYNLKNVNKEEIEGVQHSKIPISFITQGEIKVYVDPLSEMYLLGTTIDYILEDYGKGVYESKFIFLPDKDRAGSCGCGISFYIKE